MFRNPVSLARTEYSTLVLDPSSSPYGFSISSNERFEKESGSRLMMGNAGVFLGTIFFCCAFAGNRMENNIVVNRNLMRQNGLLY